MELLFQRLVDGLSDGAVYSLVALALVLVFRSTGILNFAQGEMGMICAFVTWQLWQPNGGFGLPLFAAIAAGVLAGGILGAVLERVVIRQFEDGDHMRTAMVTMGILLIITSIAGFVFSTATQRMPSPFPAGQISLAGAVVSKHTIGTMITLGAVGLLLWWLFTKTTLGITLRASSMNAESSRLLGIDVSRNLMIGWGLAGGLGALAAIVIAPTLFLSTSMMSTVLMYGFAAAVVGGLESPFGAVLGGLIVGVIQSMASAYVPFIGTQLQLLSALAVVLIVLLLRPQGIFGRKNMVRV